MVERLLAKEKVEGSNPFFRSIIFARLRSRQKPPMATMFTQPTDQLRHDIQAALEAGVPREDLLDLVNIAFLHVAGGTTNSQVDGNGHKVLELATDGKELPIFAELPEGLIGLTAAADELGCNIHRIRTWVHNGRVHAKGRLRAPARGGGYLLVSLEELRTELTKAQNGRGRPRKNS